MSRSDEALTGLAPPDASLLTLRLPAKAEYLVLARLVLTGLTRSYPIDVDTLSDLKLALTEACSNSIRHAYDGVRGVVEIRYEVAGGYLAIDVIDDGPGFESVDGQADPDLLNEGGLGLAIIRAVSDGVTVGRRQDGQGSSVRFVRNL